MFSRGKLTLQYKRNVLKVAGIQLFSENQFFGKSDLDTKIINFRRHHFHHTTLLFTNLPPIPCPPPANKRGGIMLDEVLEGRGWEDSERWSGER